MVEVFAPAVMIDVEDLVRFLDGGLATCEGLAFLTDFLPQLAREKRNKHMRYKYKLVTNGV